MSVGDTVKWISGEGDVESDSIGLIVSVIMCMCGKARCRLVMMGEERTWAGGNDDEIPALKATLSSLSGTGDPTPTRAKNESARSEGQSMTLRGGWARGVFK